MQSPAPNPIRPCCACGVRRRRNEQATAHVIRMQILHSRVRPLRRKAHRAFCSRPPRMRRLPRRKAEAGSSPTSRAETQTNALRKIRVTYALLLSWCMRIHGDIMHLGPPPTLLGPRGAAFAGRPKKAEKLGSAQHGRRDSAAVICARVNQGSIRAFANATSSHGLWRSSCTRRNV